VKDPVPGDIIGSNLNVANGGTDEQTIIDSRTINPNQLTKGGYYVDEELQQDS